MSRHRTISPAEERLLDAALSQVLAPVRATRRARTSWVAAAVLLLGVVVTATTMWRAPTPSAAVVQDAAPLRPAVRADGRAALLDLPADVDHLVASLVDPEHTDVLIRFKRLRRLVLVPLAVSLGPIKTGMNSRAWNDPPADWLAPLAELPQLESLQLASRIAVTPTTLAALTKCARLRELDLAGEGVRLEDALVAAFCALPSLRSLRLDLIRIDADCVRRLRTLHLDSLELSRPIGFDRAAFGAVLELENLERLACASWGRSFQWYGTNHEFWMPTPEELRMLVALPRLRELELSACALGDEHVSALPAALTTLTVRLHELTPDGLRALRRLSSLRRLTLGAERYGLGILEREPEALRMACGDAVAEVVGTLRLTHFDYRGTCTSALFDAIAGQPDLERLQLYGGRLDDLSALARAPALRHLILGENIPDPALSLAVLRPLRHCRALVQLEVYPPHTLDVAEITRLLGDRVRVVDYTH